MANLLVLLRVGMAELMLSEPKDKVDDYQYMKAKLLERYRLNAETCRQKFCQYPRNPHSPWKNIIFEINLFLEGWLSCLQVLEFEGLKNLLVTDQILRRAFQKMREHLMDKN